MTKFLEYLNERTFNIGVDVDYIYKELFHKYIKLLPDYDKFFNEIEKKRISPTFYLFGMIQSSKLRTKDCKKAHELNPIDIKGGVFDGNFYLPRQKAIEISLHKDVLLILRSNRSRNSVENLIGSKDINRFFNELTPPNIKGTIYHELSHWLNDSLHNWNISRRILKADQTQNYDILKKHGYALFTDYELDAQVHAIKQLKRNYKKDWDKLTWLDIINLKGSFDVIFTRLKTLNKKDQMDYFKRMSKRLNREKLLGKGLKNTFFEAIRKA